VKSDQINDEKKKLNKYDKAYLGLQKNGVYYRIASASKYSIVRDRMIISDGIMELKRF
jgi:hypothetical protein